MKMWQRSSQYHARVCRACDRGFYGNTPLCIHCRPKEGAHVAEDEAHVSD